MCQVPSAETAQEGTRSHVHKVAGPEPRNAAGIFLVKAMLAKAIKTIIEATEQ